MTLSERNGAITEDPNDRVRYRIPHNQLVTVREPWPITRMHGLRIYLGWWLDDVRQDLANMLRWRR